MNSSLAPAMIHADQAQVVMLQGIASRIKAAIDEQGIDVFHGGVPTEWWHAHSPNNISHGACHTGFVCTAFKAFDVNGDGCLSRAELMTMFVSLNTGVSPAQLQEIIRASDANSDGYISYQEFVAGALGCPLHGYTLEHTLLGAKSSALTPYCCLYLSARLPRLSATVR